MRLRVVLHLSFLGWTLAAALVRPDCGLAVEPARQSFPPAVVIEGTPHERGAAYGRSFRDGVQHFLNQEIYEAFVGNPSSKEELLAYAAACGAVMREYCPLVAEEFAGIAEGAGLTFDEVVLINLHEELYHRGELPMAGHCTAVAVGPPTSGDDRTYVGQTWDWMESVAGTSAVVEWRRAGGPSVIAYGFPGMPMGAGMNSAGIALCWTSAALGRPSQSPRVGVPSYALIAHLLAQADLEQVIREAEKNKQAGWFTFVLAYGEGNLVNIEGSPEGVAVERGRGRMVRIDYGTRRMSGAPAGEPIPRHERCVRMDELLAAAAGRNDLAQLQAYFAQPEYAINVGRHTIDMMVFDATARRAYLSRGLEHGFGWREFGFGK
jgi:hypothetical protein